MLPWIPVALALESSSSLEDWDGGTIDGDTLSVSSGSATLTTGEMTSFSFSARLRLVEGNGLALLAGDAAVQLVYTTTGGVRFGDTEIPFSASERAWTADDSPVLRPEGAWEGTALGSPDVVAFEDGWLLYYTGADAEIGVASSTDLESWTRYADPLLTGTNPGAVVVDTDVVLFYDCDGAICRAASANGLEFVDGGVVIDEGSRPSPVLGDDGAWTLYYTLADGTPVYTTSEDGVSWADPTPIDDGYAGVDVGADAYGFEGVYSIGDGLGWAVGEVDPALGDSDVVPLLEVGDVVWASSTIGDAAWVLDGTTLHVFFAGDDSIGHARTTPRSGAFGFLDMEWDGTSCTAAWDGGPTLTVDLDAADGFELLPDGTVEMEQVDVSWSVPGGETGDTAGDTGDTAGDTATDSGDTAIDSGDTAIDSGDTAGDTATDSASGPLAAEEYGEPGGYLCGTVRAPYGLALLGLLALRRGRR